MWAIEQNGRISTYRTLPKVWGQSENIKEDFARELGFKKVVTPIYDKQTQRLGALELDTANDVYTYPVVDIDFSAMVDIVEEVNGEIVVTGQRPAYDVDALKVEKIKQLKDEAGVLLKVDDWQVTRKSEKGIELDADVAAKRDRIRAKCDAKEVEINALTTYVEVLKYEITYLSPKLDVNGAEILDEFGKPVMEC